MALYWPEAALAVTCEETASPEEAKAWPDNVLVISMREGQSDDPEFVEAVRDLVIDRVLERRRLLMEDLFELGATMPEPRGGTRDGDDATDAERAEARLRKSLLEDGPGWDAGEAGERDEGYADWRDDDPYERDWLGWRAEDVWPERGLGYGMGCEQVLGLPGRAPAQLVVNHCDQLIVHE